jgi:hypothetical protein
MDDGRPGMIDPAMMAVIAATSAGSFDQMGSSPRADLRR